MKRTLRLTAGLAAFAVVAGAQALTFRITFENLGPQPLSPIFVASGNSSFDIFTAGQAASAEIQAVAEMGDANPLNAFAASQQALGHVLDHKLLNPAGPLMPGQSVTGLLEADEAHRWLSFASMLGMTNDGFIGSAFGENDFQIDLFNNNRPLNANFTISFLNAWDAGTEVNTEDAADLPGLGGFGSPAENGVIFGPHMGIRGDNDLPVSFDWYGQDIARVSIEAVPEPITALALAPALLLLRRKRR